LSMCTPNIYDIILLLRNLMYFLFSIVFKLCWVSIFAKK
jgi:hypothetical protein